MNLIRFNFLATALLLISMLGIPKAFAASPSLITGHWTAIDPLDGDTVHMILSGGNEDVYQLSAFDLHAPLVCLETSGLGLLKGTATFSESTGLITKTVVASCPAEGITYPQNTLEMYYDAATDTIHDHTFNLLYTR